MAEPGRKDLLFSTVSPGPSSSSAVSEGGMMVEAVESTEERPSAWGVEEEVEVAEVAVPTPKNFQHQHHRHRRGRVWRERVELLRLLRLPRQR